MGNQRREGLARSETLSDYLRTFLSVSSPVSSRVELILWSNLEAVSCLWRWKMAAQARRGQMISRFLNRSSGPDAAPVEQHLSGEYEGQISVTISAIRVAEDLQLATSSLAWSRAKAWSATITVSETFPLALYRGYEDVTELLMHCLLSSIGSGSRDQALWRNICRRLGPPWQPQTLHVSSGARLPTSRPLWRNLYQASRPAFHFRCVLVSSVGLCYQEANLEVHVQSCKIRLTTWRSSTC